MLGQDGNADDVMLPRPTFDIEAANVSSPARIATSQSASGGVAPDNARDL
jgi:hypothetical protein